MGPKPMTEFERAVWDSVLGDRAEALAAFRKSIAEMRAMPGDADSYERFKARMRWSAARHRLSEARSAIRGCVQCLGYHPVDGTRLLRVTVTR
jgi:hypothetical protein